MSINTIRHKENPFISSGAWIPVGTKTVRLSRLGADDNILINQNTGEINGTHVVARKKVDKERFVKTFADYMAFTFDLSKAGNKALRVLMWAMKEYGRGKDMVLLDRYTHEEFMEKHKKMLLNLSYPTFSRGLAELEKAKIIAKTLRPGFYFINPNCLFNGDRIVFSTIIEKESNEDANMYRDPNTIDLINGKADNEQ